MEMFRGKQPIIYTDKKSDINEISIIPEHNNNECKKYKIVLPNNPREKNIRRDSKDIAKALAAFSLCYKEIKDEKNTISIKKLKRDFKEFSDALLNARKSNVQTVLAKIRETEGSGERNQQIGGCFLPNN
jgi:hypothetical protein